MIALRVLIADDHETARIGIGKALAETGNIELVAEVSNGVELIEALERTTFEFLIMDVSMPHFDPLRAIELIRVQYPSMFVLVVSAYDDDTYVKGLLNAGVHGYHLKDQPLSDLKLAIDRIRSGHKWVSSVLINKILSTPNQSSIELSPRQVDIARGLSKGLSNREIAAHLRLSIKTIENHLTRLYRQLGVNSRLEAVTHIHENPHLLGLSGKTLSRNTPDPVPPSGGPSIIVVDDNQRFRRQLCGIIGRNYPHVTIYEAGNWAELHMIAKHQACPTFIFMDVVLGDENGISHTRKIKQKFSDVTVVLITAYPDREFHRLGLESGALALIDKKDLDTPTIKQILCDVIS